MKKYYQLLLVVISVISLISVIVYRNEYNRLRYVLEVLNFFGKPSDVENNCLVSDNITLNNNVYNIPMPAWQALGDAYHIYSAFWDKKYQGGTVQAIAISSTPLVPALMCNIWFLDQEKPVKGKFSVKNLPSNKNENTHKSYIFSCSVQRDFGIPFTVTFYNNSNKIPVTSSIPIFSNEFLKDGDDALICIKPDNMNRNPTRIVEFLNFYQVLGIKKFIVYDNGHIIPTLISSIIGLDITVLPWNSPFRMQNDFLSSIIETDCMLRVKNTADMVVVLNWNELIVPSQHTTVISLIRDSDPLQQSGKFQIAVQEFCTDFEDHEPITKMQLIFHKLHYRKTDENLIPIIRSKTGKDELAIKSFEDDTVVLQRYVKCFEKNRTNKLERSSTILRFNTDFVKTVLYQLWTMGKLLR